MEENGEAEVDLSTNMAEEEVLKIVRELLGDDEMTDEDLRVAYRDGAFQELGSDIALYAKLKPQKESSNQDQNTSDRGNSNNGVNQERKSEVENAQPQPGPSQLVENFAGESEEKKVEIKQISLTESRDSSKSSNSLHKKKKKKHKQGKIRDERRKSIKANDHRDKIQAKIGKKLLSESDSEDDRKHWEQKCKKYKKIRNRIISCDDDSSSISTRTSSDRKRKQKPNSHSAKNQNDNIKKKTIDDKVAPEKKEIPKIHSDKATPGTSQSFQIHQTPKNTEHPKGTVIEKEEEPKPFSKYNSSVSKTNINRWRPILHHHHMRHLRKFKLKTVSIICVDLLDLPMIFHHPRRPSTTPKAVPLKGHVSLSEDMIKKINRREKLKVLSFKANLNRRVLKFMKFRNSLEDSRTPKRAKMIDPIVSSRSRIRKPINEGKVKVPKCIREAKTHNRKIEEVKKKVEIKTIAANGTRKLPQENKEEYFKKDKKKVNADKEKEKAILAKKKRAKQLKAEKVILPKLKRRAEELKLEETIFAKLKIRDERLKAEKVIWPKLKQRAEELKLEETMLANKIRAEQLKVEKVKNTPSIIFVAKIETAAKTEPIKPKVVLKIPKFTNSQSLQIEYKVKDNVNVGDIASEVARLLSSNTKVECPVIPEPDNHGTLGEYTVKKIAWWLLKNEVDPAPVGHHHPELHDDDDFGTLLEDEIHWPSDVSSINGCVSDPEGALPDVPLDPSKVKDADWVDEYCGLACLFKVGKVRKPNPPTSNLESPSSEYFWPVFKTKPDTNYEKPTFEAWCQVCSERIPGQRQLGAHIRSTSHKDTFRNYSLNLANYEEDIKKVAPKKEFVAKLVKYYLNNLNVIEKSDMSEKIKYHVGKIKPVRSDDSPRPLIGGKATHANGAVDVHEMPIPDQISLPDIEDYDLSSDESLLQVKVEIRTMNKWDGGLEMSWRQWNNEQVNIVKNYNQEREYYIDHPEKQPKYHEEWQKFWDRRCLELEAEGVNTSTYDFRKEWMPFWLKRVQEIIKEKAEQYIAAKKRAYGIDKHTLRQRFGISAEATKRKTKKKMKNGDKQEDSGINTSSRVPSISVIQHQMPSCPPFSGMELQPNCLPTLATPPVTSGETRDSSNKHRDNHHRNGDRRREDYGRNRYRKENRSKNDYHRRRKYHRDDRRKYEGHRDRR